MNNAARLHLAPIILAAVASLAVLVGPLAAMADESSLPDTDDPTPEVIEEIVTDDRPEDPSRDELDDSQTDRLTKTLQAAIDAEEEGDHRAARQQFADAYQIHPHSNILLSVARTSDHLGEEETAMAGYRTFLKRQPDYANRADIEDRIAYLEQSVADQQREIETVDTPLPSAVGWAGVGTATAGVASLIAAAAVASSVDREFTALETAVEEGQTDASLQRAREIGRRQAWGQVWMYGGLTMLAAGATLVAVDYLMLDRPSLFTGSESDDSSSTYSPTVAAGADSVLLQWNLSF